MTSRASELLSGGASGPITTAAEHRLAVCRLPHGAVPRHARSHAGVSQERLRSHVALRGRLHGQGSLGAGHRFRRDARHQRVLPACAAGRRGHAQSGGRRDLPRHRAGTSQSGNFIKTFIHLGFNEDESRRIVWDGAWPFIAARQNPTDFRFAIPGGAAGVNEPGSEPVLWWHTYHDKARDREAGEHARSLPQRPTPARRSSNPSARPSSGTCACPPASWEPTPSATFRCLPTSAATTTPARRMAAAGRVRIRTRRPDPPACCRTIRTRNSILSGRCWWRSSDWVVKGTPPPPSRYPTLHDGLLVRATKAATGFPTIPFPGLPASAPDGLINSVLDYDFGRELNYNDLTGVITRAAADHQAGAADPRRENESRRQRDRRGAVGAPPGAAGHLSRLEHQGGRVLQGPDMRLHRRLCPVCAARRPSAWHPAIRVDLSKSAMAARRGTAASCG